MNCPNCKKHRSNSGKLFTDETLKQHIKDAHPDWEIGNNTFELTNMFTDDDMPDGAYFAMAWELGEL